MDFIVNNLQLVFANVPEVTIDVYRSLKSWIKEASHKQYWTQLVMAMTTEKSKEP